MELSNPFKLVPSSMYLPLAIVAGGLLAWRFLFTGGDSGDVSNPTSPSMGYDPSLVALGVQTSLERDKLAASTELGKLTIATEMHALDVQSDMQAREVGLANITNDREVNLASATMLSQERMFGADLSLKNSELSVMQTIGMAEQETARLTSFNDVEKARVAGNASVAAAKAGKSKSIGFGKFKLSF